MDRKRSGGFVVKGGQLKLLSEILAEVLPHVGLVTVQRLLVGQAIDPAGEFTGDGEQAAWCSVCSQFFDREEQLGAGELDSQAVGTPVWQIMGLIDDE